MGTLETAAAKAIVSAIERDCLDVELQPKRDRIVVWVDGVPFALRLEQLK